MSIFIIGILFVVCVSVAVAMRPSQGELQVIAARGAGENFELYAPWVAPALATVACLLAALMNVDKGGSTLVVLLTQSLLVFTLLLIPCLLVAAAACRSWRFLWSALWTLVLLLFSLMSAMPDDS